ncbi:MAG: alanine racemase, partial [Acidimicrobiaceae bacterium]|nr:alanine racemase [Acidimicrobiaceae bacterium]
MGLDPIDPIDPIDTIDTIDDVARHRWAWADVDAEALRHNVASVVRTVAPAEVRAVVKADGYGHGAITTARAALDGGATGLCVALVQEGVELRSAGIDAPTLVLTEQPPDQLTTLVVAGLEATAYRFEYVRALAAAASSAGTVVPVHVKVDTGMQRVGADPTDLAGLVDAVRSSPSLDLGGVFTHLAVADEPDHGATAYQLERFDRAIDSIAGVAAVPAIHAANSAGALAVPAARFSFVRLGIAMYGISPGPEVDHLVADLRPALSLKARVAYVKRVEAGTHVSYGWRHRFDRDTTVATVPIGYADG